MAVSTRYLAVSTQYLAVSTQYLAVSPNFWQFLLNFWQFGSFYLITGSFYLIIGSFFSIIDSFYFLLHSGPSWCTLPKYQVCHKWLRLERCFLCVTIFSVHNAFYLKVLAQLVRKLQQLLSTNCGSKWKKNKMKVGV